MKNRLYIVYGGKCEEDEDYNVYYTEDLDNILTFKNKDKAVAYKEKLLDEYMKTKSYSPNYTIDETYTIETPLVTHIDEIRDKHDYCVFKVEILEIDLSNLIM